MLIYMQMTLLFYHESTSCVELMLTLRIELSTVQQWLYANKLTPNVKQTKLMVLGIKPKLREIPTRQIQLSLNGETIESVTTFKYLGIMIDNELTFESHLDYISIKNHVRS